MLPLALAAALASVLAALACSWASAHAPAEAPAETPSEAPAPADRGLLLHYTFDEGAGPLARDASGAGHHGAVSGTAFVEAGQGLALRLDGVDDRVDCGAPAGLDLREAVTIEAWVQPERLPDREVGVVAKGVDSYGLTWYTDGRCWFYISGGGNNCKASIAPGFWHHVAGTFDGREMRLYVDGQLRDSRALSAAIRPGGPLLIGDRGDARGSCFVGLVDEVRVWSRALSAAEVLASCRRSERAALLVRKPVKAAETLEGEGFRVLVGAAGGVQVEVGGDAFILESLYSYPGDPSGTNALAEEGPRGEEGWRPRVTRPGPGTVGVEARGAAYSLVRVIQLEGHRVAIADTMSALGAEDVGVAVRHRLVTAERPAQVLLAGAGEAAQSLCAENPTVFLALGSGRLGLAAEDTVSRLQLELAAHSNQAVADLRHLALRPGETRTLRWALYPLGPDGPSGPDAAKADYFDFINRLRRDWKANFKVDGPWDFLDVTARWDLLHDPERLKAYLARKKLRIVALTPWLDYDHFNYRTGTTTTREEYKALMREAAAALKAANPEIRCTGCMEGNLVSLPPEAARAVFEALPPDGRESGIRPFTDAQMQAIRGLRGVEGLPLRWKDCLLTAPDGRYTFEIYFRGPKSMPMVVIAVYAAPGNDQEAYWLEQARFMLEEVGLDGIYIDQFSLAFSSSQRYSFERWDGVTVDLDPRTGRIARRYTDGALAGVGARKRLIDYVLPRGGVMVTNTNCAVEELQSRPLARFIEAEWAFDPLALGEGKEPPLLATLSRAQLGSPVALGYRPGRLGEAGGRQYARAITKAAITHLRHGVLYYHYGTEIPEAGPGAGEYGPVNRMFPITVRRLGEGWIEGEERIVTAVSGDFPWPRAARPRARRFDATGREVPADFAVAPAGTGWGVEVRVRDWEEVVVIEE
ncbi:MAG: LamG domain-containing protein [Planctomycetes bacterium]|nr:LamG domain-containing protein [Planctomycetota bacterium]